MPKVTSGLAGGLQLKSLAGHKTRPTADKVKQGVFSALSPRLTGSSFLDLYAGSGQIAIEAKSRGAGLVVAVEKSRPACRLITENIRSTGLDISLLQMSATSALQDLIRQDLRFSLVYFDPPWMLLDRELEKNTDLIKDCLESDGLLLVEHDFKQELNLQELGWHIVKQYRYGQTEVTVCRP